jgi:hypothetical protein
MNEEGRMQNEETAHGRTPDLLLHSSFFILHSTF